MGTQAKYYQIIESEIEKSIKQLKIDEDFYSTINDPRIISNKIDLDKSYTFMSEFIESLSNNRILSKLAFYGIQIETQYNYQCEVQYITNSNVCEIAKILNDTQIISKDKFIERFNKSQENAYVITDVSFFNYYWIHYRSIVEFYSKCKDENSAILVLIG